MVERAVPRDAAARTGGARYFANVAAQAAGRFAFMLSTALVWVLCARWLGASVFGEFAYVMAYVGVVGAFAEAGTTWVLARDLAARRDDPSAAAYLGNFILARVALGAVAAAGAGAIQLLLGRDDTLILLVASAAAPIGAARFFDPVFQVFDRPWRAAPVAIAASAVSLAGSILVLVLFAHPILPLIIVYALSGTVYVMLALWMTRDVLVPRFALDIPLLRATFALSLPIGVGSIVAAVNSRIGTFVLEHTQSSAAVAELVAAGKLLELSSIVAVTLCTPLLPMLVRSIGRPGGLSQAAERLFELLAAVTFPSAILAWHLAPSLITLIYGQNYSAAGAVARILVLQLPLLPFALVTSGVLLAKGIVRPAYWNGALAALINLLLNLLLVPSLTARGSAIAAVSAELSMVTVSFWFIFRSLGNVIVLRHWCKIAALCAVMIGIIEHPLIGIVGADDVLAAVVYTGAAFASGVISRTRIAAVFGHAAATQDEAGPAAIAEPTRVA
ncbi:MAG: polysaccharide biosynthesis C-terminal domain-containing protein [Alphaproteobacteria bacterium]|nr:polysaccharide biosynthesis C-terminal domain-containing protein [Alphaproteobacteria bacterium]